jgi:LysM repeat protein
MVVYQSHKNPFLTRKNKQSRFNASSGYSVFSGSKKNTGKRRSAKSPEHTLNWETEKVLRFLSFCVVVCIGAIFVQSFFGGSSTATAQESQEDVKIYTLFTDNPNTNTENRFDTTLSFTTVSGEAQASPAVTEDQADNNQNTVEAITTVAETPTQPVAETATYIVQSGDNLSVISAKFDTSTERLTQLNNLSDPRALSVGQVLLVR